MMPAKAGCPENWLAHLRNRCRQTTISLHVYSQQGLNILPLLMDAHRKQCYCQPLSWEKLGFI